MECLNSRDRLAKGQLSVFEGLELVLSQEHMMVLIIHEFKSRFQGPL